MKNAYLGIDPGQSGGLVLLDEKGAVLQAQRMPETETDLFQLLEGWTSDYNIVKGYLEKVRASPQMSKGSIWTFAQGYGTLRGFLVACRIPFEDVAPQRWQKAIGVRDKTGARELKAVDITAKKNRHKAAAQRLFPTIAITHALADAILLAEYGRRMERGFGAEFL